MPDRSLLIFGLGYTGRAIARDALAAGWRVAATSRAPDRLRAPAGVALLPFADAAPAIARATHVVATAAPDEAGDPVLQAFADVLATAPALRWAGYLSTTGVYGDRAGGWVNEATPPAPTAPRSQRRLAAEHAWARLASRIAVDLFRVAGIYGPGRSAIDDLRAGRARLVDKPGHVFGRIHRDDIAAAVLAAASQNPPPGTRILNLSDDEPSETAAVIREAAMLLGLPAPTPTPYADAARDMSEMARSFWAEDRRVSSAQTQAALGLRWQYPTYREGLRAILAEQIQNGPA